MEEVGSEVFGRITYTISIVQSILDLFYLKYFICEIVKT